MNTKLAIVSYIITFGGLIMLLRLHHCYIRYINSQYSGILSDYSNYGYWSYRLRLHRLGLCR